MDFYLSDILIEYERITKRRKTMKQSDTFYIYNRDDWSKLNDIISFQLTGDELQKLRALNDRISLEDVREVYLPIVQVLDNFIKNYRQKQRDFSETLDVPYQKRPFIIGIAGSVAVGKSTVARLLQTLLSQLYSDRKIELITTDGFLYPNEVLKEYNLMNRKGFPESYDMHRLVTFLGDVKNGYRNLKVPKYSHEIYNIVPDEYIEVNQPDILIVEGINVLQLPSSEKIYMSDFFDFSFFVDAKPERIEKWYLERFGILLDSSFKNENNYYYKFTKMDRIDAFAYAKKVWEEINLVNLNEFILPTRFRADLIIHKTRNHFIDKILLRKY